MRLDAIRTKNRAYQALANADEAIAKWRHRHYGRGGYEPLPAGWAGRREQLARKYALAAR